MQLLVSTPLHILLVNPQTNSAKTLRTGDGYYFGITFKGEAIALTHSDGPLQIYAPGEQPRVSPGVLMQPHQAEWIEDKILVANTGHNCVSVFDELGQHLKNVYLNEIHWDDKDAGRRGNHFNTVHREGEFVYVVAHNYARPSEVWQLSWPELAVINNWVTTAGWAHNYWECEHGRLICNSKDGSLYEVSSGETIWHSGETNVMTRGLAATDDYIFIGYSSYNERKMRYWKTGGVWIVERKTLRTVEKLLFPGIGDVQEIRLVGVPDACHNDEILQPESLSHILRSSLVVNAALHLRKKYPVLQQDLFPFSQLVRAAQMSTRFRQRLMYGYRN
jgi:hypothetical protein